MKKAPLFVCLSGIDGSGKTTYSQELLEYLRQQGLPAKYVWLNSKPILLAPIRRLIHKTVLRGLDMKEDYESYHRQRRRYASRWQFARKVYYGIMLLDYLLWVYWNLLPRYFRGVSIICDRYIYDLAINLGDILGYSGDEEIQLIRRLQRLLPKPTHVFICDVDEQVAFQRKRDTPHLSYLVAHRPRYRLIAEAFQFPVLDSSNSIATVMEEVRRIVGA